MTSTPRFLMIGAIALAVAGPTGSAPPALAANRKPVLGCSPNGRFFVKNGARLTQAPVGTPGVDSVVLLGGSVGIAGCTAAPVKLKPARDGSMTLTAKWKACGGLKRIRLKAKIDAGCTRMTGIRIRAKKWKPSDIDAELSDCGDRIVDQEIGESCDPPGPTCDSDCHVIAVVSPPATTTTITTSTGTTATSTTLPHAVCEPLCGNGQIDAECDEQCDGSVMGAFADCACTDDCTVDERTCECQGARYTSTWDAIQQGIFARHQCTNPSCHGGSLPQGGLDLRPGAAYQALVGDGHGGVPSHANPAVGRVKLGRPTESFLWLKLAKATDPEAYADAIRVLRASDVGTPMPFGFAPLSEDELEVLKRWIHAGAPSEGTIAGTAEMLSACLPPGDPIKIIPPAPPATTDGVQFYAPPWTIQPRDPATGRNGEDEICQATYFDFSNQIPVEQQFDCPAYWGLGNKCFYLNRTELTQDPNSHHSIIHIYRGQYLVGSSEYMQGFGPFTCRGGELAQQACDPAGPATQCPGSACAGRIQRSIACLLFGPDDYGFDITGMGSDNAPSVGGSQQPYFDSRYASGAFGVFPVKGTMVWNSHAFNVTSQPTTNEQYFNVLFAKTPQERRFIARGIFDSRYIFTQDVPPFEQREYCGTFTLPKGAALTGLSSHTHKRGVRFRIWEPPNSSCTPCAIQPGGFAGCRQPNPACRPDDSRPAVATTTEYDDPIQFGYDPPRDLTQDDPASRTVKYCALYDNGFENPEHVKRRSTSPPTPLFAGIAPGGPCAANRAACMDGPNKGRVCGAAGTEPNHSFCDSQPGLSDGLCDACPLRGGVTTADEMFLLLGSWYCSDPDQVNGCPLAP